MHRRGFILGAIPLSLLADTVKRDTVRGKLVEGPAVRTNNGWTVGLEADAPSIAVLRDPRIMKEEFLGAGEFAASDRFRLDPIHKKALFVVRDGKPLVVTYWCDVCAIRTYSPGKCGCCQEETAFDPRDPSLENTSI